MLEFLSNPLFIGLAGLSVTVAFAFLFLKKAKPKTEVLYCRERDRRGQRLFVTEESAHSLKVERKGLLGSNPGPLRFIKLAGAYVFIEAGKAITRFFGKEGTAYTWTLQGDMAEEELKLGTLTDSLKGIWGEDFYNEIPEEQKRTVENANVLVTVKLNEGFTPDKFSPIKEEDITHEEETRAARILGKGIKERTAGKTLYEGLLWMAVGFALCFVLYNIGVFH